MDGENTYNGNFHPLQVAKFILQLPEAHINYTSSQKNGEISVTLTANLNELKKLEQMMSSQKEAVPPAMVPEEEPVPAMASSNVVVRVALDQKEQLRKKYPQDFLDSIHIG